MANNLDCTQTGRAPHLPFQFVNPPVNHNEGAKSDGQHDSPGRLSNISHKRSNVEFDNNGHMGGQAGVQANGQGAGLTFEQLSEQVKILMAITLENKSTNVSLAKRYKAEREWKSMGNKFQYDVNISVVVALDEALYSLSVNNFVNARNCIMVARTLMEERNKHIIMAENSEFGWATVNAYLNGNMSLDDDEDKRYKRAENLVRTVRKTKQETTTSTRGRGRGRGKSTRGAYTEAQPQAHVVAPLVPNYNPYAYGQMYAPEIYAQQFPRPPFPAVAGHFPGQMYVNVSQR
jgi:hypothetical protein